MSKTITYNEISKNKGMMKSMLKTYESNIGKMTDIDISLLLNVNINVLYRVLYEVRNTSKVIKKFKDVPQDIIDKIKGEPSEYTAKQIGFLHNVTINIVHKIIRPHIYNRDNCNVNDVNKVRYITYAEMTETEEIKAKYINEIRTFLEVIDSDLYKVELITLQPIITYFNTTKGALLKFIYNNKLSTKRPFRGTINELTIEERDEIFKYYNDNKDNVTYIEMCLRFNIMLHLFKVICIPEKFAKYTTSLKSKNLDRRYKSTIEQRDEVIKLFNDGYNTYEISDKLGLAYHIISRIKRNNIDKLNSKIIHKSVKLNNETRQHIADLYATNKYTYDGLAKKYNVSTDTIRRIVKGERVKEIEPMKIYKQDNNYNNSHKKYYAYRKLMATKGKIK